MSARVVVVLGYSDGRGPGLHPICAERLAQAAALTTADDVVVLSGWARRPGGRSEAALMREAWSGPARRVVVDEDARTTAENAANALDDIAAAEATEVVVVTSRWHARRARAAFRWLLRGSRVGVTVAAAGEGSVRATLRELALWPLLPAQIRHARRGARA